MTDPRSSSPASEATLFDVEEFRASDNAHRHAIIQVADDVSPTQRLLCGGLPVATSLRWKPLRCGLINLYLFDNEVFPFADGRLLLRGDNGAGKSRVLALTLPLLLDGRLHPSRVEPDRDSNRQIAWNLLMDEHQDRTGYTWIEFGRTDDAGRSHYVTLGIGLRGVRGRGITDHWMFVTNQRIGAELSLITPERRVASKRVLTDALASRGQLYESSTEYRRAVDESLFRLNERYEALLDLLLQLRQPQLAKKLDLEGLEAALVQAMPPVSPTLLSDAADAFRSLDRERETLTGLQQARTTVLDFLRPYRRHLRLGIRRAAGRLRARHSKYEQAGKNLRDASRKKEEIDADVVKISEDRDGCLRRQHATGVALHTLQADPAMKQAERLNSARQLHDAAFAALNRARHDGERLDLEVTESAHESEASRTELIRRVQRALELKSEAAVLAAPQPLQANHTELFAQLLTGEHSTSDNQTTPQFADGVLEKIDDAEQSLTAQMEHWVRTGQHLQELNRRVQESSGFLQAAIRRLDDAQDHLQSIADEVTLAADNVDSTAKTLWSNLDQWWKSGESLAISTDDHERLHEEWLEWSQTLDGVSPATSAADGAVRKVASAIAMERSTLFTKQQELQNESERLSTELNQLHNGHANGPHPIPGSERSSDAGLSGAAFWQLVEFLPAIAHEDRAGWEAALESAGLLNAWVHPDGQLNDTGRLDTTLTVKGEEIGAADARLSRILSPAATCDGYGVSSEVIGQILDRIGITDDHAVRVRHDGRWQLGPLAGHWNKPIPQFIGSDVRDAWRDRRIEELEQSLATLEAERTDTQRQLDQLKAREERADRHRLGLPDDGPLRSAVAHQQQAVRQQQAAQHRVSDAAAQERQRRHQRDECLTARNATAMDVNLQDWSDAPDKLLQQLDSYKTHLTACIEAWRVAASASERCSRTKEFETRKREEHTSHQTHLQSLEQQEQTRRAALEELQKTVGVDAKEITRRIADREAELEQLALTAEQLADDLRQAEKSSARLEARLETLDARLEESDGLRREAADSLCELAALTLLPTADADLSDVLEAPASLTAAVELARRIEKLGWRVADADDDEAWKRNQRQIYDALEPLKGRLTSFSMNAEPEFIGEHVCRVQIRHQANLVTPDQLVRRLDTEIDEHERVLSENERTILEKHLLGEVAGELHERMGQARELVDSMNREVSSRPMKTGMQMRFRWEPDVEGPTGLAQACRVLAMELATWSDSDRRELGEFLHEQITASREQDDPGSRLEQLTRALDYRNWHRLRIDRRASKDQDWKLLTRKTYGSGSGGEKAIALTLPQVAAAAAYYRTADPLAPRLILMDEVFAGISANNRAACMELLAAFELDVVMTSESEWGCYATVPQLAICQLTRVPDLAAIDNTVFVWNGKERVGSRE